MDRHNFTKTDQLIAEARALLTESPSFAAATETTKMIEDIINSNLSALKRPTSHTKALYKTPESAISNILREFAEATSNMVMARLKKAGIKANRKAIEKLVTYTVMLDTHNYSQLSDAMEVTTKGSDWIISLSKPPHLRVVQSKF
jgi:hypothetical protein